MYNSEKAAYPETYFSIQFGTDISHLHDFMANGTSESVAAIALEGIVEGYNSTLHKEAQRFRFVRNLEHEDFVQTGVEGLFDALSRADPSVPPRAFIAYSKLRILDHMFRLSAEAGGSISVNEGVLKRLTRAKRIQIALEEDDSLDLAELLHEAGLSIRQYQQSMVDDQLLNPLSLDTEDVDADSSIIGSAGSFEDSSSYSTDPAEICTTLDPEQEEALLAKSIEVLDQDRQYITNSYYGLNGHEKADQLKIGEKFGLTSSRISQILSDIRGILYVDMQARHLNPEAVELASRELQPLAKDLLARFYGFGSGQSMELEEVAQEFGITEDRARFVINKALRKIATYLYLD